MYKIICIDYENEKIKDLCNIAYIDRAKDLCSCLALNYVLSKEGLNYLQKKITDKYKVKKGYFMITKEKPFYMKISIYNKELNGYLYSGELKKIRQYITVSVNLPKIESRDKSEFKYQLDYEEVLIELLDTITRYEDTIENI